MCCSVHYVSDFMMYKHTEAQTANHFIHVAAAMLALEVHRNLLLHCNIFKKLLILWNLIFQHPSTNGSSHCLVVIMVAFEHFYSEN